MKRVLQKDPVRWFLFIEIVCIICLAFILWYSNGSLLRNYFWNDPIDTGMDFFNSLAYTRNGVPYSQYHTLYTPLANLFFYALLQFVPESYVNSWENSFSELINMRLSTNDLRMYQSTLLLFLLFLVGVTAFTIIIVQHILKKKGWFTASIVAVLIVTSFGFIYGVERGNIIVLVFSLCLFYLHNYHNKNRVLREIAYISLAIAAGLKIYPAFLGVLLIYDKNWKAMVRTLLYGVLMLIMPCFFFKDGLNSITMFFNILFSHGNRAVLELHHTGTGLQDIAGNVIAVIAKIAHMDESNFVTLRQAVQFFAYFLCGGLLALSLSAKWKNWMRIMLICLAMTCLQSGGYYTLVYMLIPIIHFIDEEEHLNNRNIVFFVPLVALALQVPLFDLNNGVKLKALFIQTNLILLWIIVLYYVFKMLQMKVGNKEAVALQDFLGRNHTKN